MPRRSIATALSLSAWLVTCHASAQTTRTEQIDEEKAAKAANVRPEARETGDLVITKLETVFTPASPALRVTFGGFRPAAGLGGGVGYSRVVGDDGVWDTTAAWSVKNFKRAETSLYIPVLLPSRMHVRPYVKWDDSPDLPFFGLGPATSPGDVVGYGLRSTEAGADVTARVARWFTIGGGASYLGARSSASTPSIEALLANEGGASGSSSPAWLHTSAFAAIDWRTSTGYTDSGGLYRVAFHDYADRANAFDFSRTEVDLRQFIPILHNNWIIGMQALAEITASADGQVIPFFMLPSIGGRDTLPGFADYRFTDRNSLLLRSELRWTPSPVVDMAVFLDQGTVAARADALDLRDLKRGSGISLRFHGRNFTALRLEVAHGGEGWRYIIDPGISF